MDGWGQKDERGRKLDDKAVLDFYAFKGKTPLNIFLNFYINVT